MARGATESAASAAPPMADQAATEKSALPLRVSAEDLATLLNLTPRRVRQMAREGIIPPPAKAGEYDLVGCSVAYVKHLQSRAAGKQPSREVDKREKLLLDARIEKARLEASKLAGRSVDLDEVLGVAELAWRAVAKQFSTMGGRLRDELAVISDSIEIQKRIDEEARRILEAASRDLERLGDRE